MSKFVSKTSLLVNDEIVSDHGFVEDGFRKALHKFFEKTPHLIYTNSNPDVHEEPNIVVTVGNEEFDGTNTYNVSLIILRFLML